jgi:hypothetical protein
VLNSPICAEVRTDTSSCCRRLGTLSGDARSTVCFRRFSVGSSVHTQDTEDFAESIIANVTGNRGAGSAWMPVPTSPASEHLRAAAAQCSSCLSDCSSALVTSRDTMVMSHKTAVASSDQHGMSLRFQDDTLVGNFTLPNPKQSPILSMHMSAGIIECEPSKSQTVRRSLLAAHSPMSCHADSPEFTFPTLDVPPPAPGTPDGSPQPTGTQDEDAYAKFAKFLSGASYQTPMPGASNGISPSDVAASTQTQVDVGVRETHHEEGLRRKLPAETPHLWGMQQNVQAGAAPTTPTYGQEQAGGAAFSFAMAVQARTLNTPRFGSIDAVPSPSVFAASGIDNAAPLLTPVAFGGAVLGNAPIFANSDESAAWTFALPCAAHQNITAAGSPVNPFSELRWKAQKHSDSIKDVASARSSILQMQKCASSLTSRPMAVLAKGPPPGTPPFTKLMRHLNPGKHHAAAAPSVLLPPVASHPHCAMQHSLAVPARCVLPPRPPPVPSNAMKQVETAGMGSPMHFDALVHNIKASLYESPALPHDANRMRSPSEAISAPPSAESCTSIGEGTPRTTLQCPLSEREPASRDKSAGDQSSALQIHSLHFSGASDTNDCSPVSGIARSCLTTAAPRSPMSCADESSPPPDECSSSNPSDRDGATSPPFSSSPSLELHVRRSRACGTCNSTTGPLHTASASSHRDHSPLSDCFSTNETSVLSTDAPPIRVRLEPVVSVAGEPFLLLHCQIARDKAVDDELFLQPNGCEFSPLLSTVPQRADRHAPSGVGRSDIWRVSEVSDMVVMGDHTPRDSEDVDKAVVKRSASLSMPEVDLASGPVEVPSPVVQEPVCASEEVDSPVMFGSVKVSTPAVPELSRSVSPDLPGVSLADLCWPQHCCALLALASVHSLDHLTVSA